MLISRASWRLRRISASAARGGVTALVLLLDAGAAMACPTVLTVMMPLPIGSARATESSISPCAESCETMSKWMVSPRMTQPSATTPS